MRSTRDGGKMLRRNVGLASASVEAPFRVDTIIARGYSHKECGCVRHAVVFCSEGLPLFLPSSWSGVRSTGGTPGRTTRTVTLSSFTTITPRIDSPPHHRNLLSPSITATSATHFGHFIHHSVPAVLVLPSRPNRRVFGRVRLLPLAARSTLPLPLAPPLPVPCNPFS